MAKTITIVVPTYNEAANIQSIYDRVLAVFKSSLTDYNMQLLFIDNDSQDETRALIRELAASDDRVQAIFNATKIGRAHV